MLRKNIFTLFALAVCLSISTAQNPNLETYDREGIYLRTEFWRGNVYVKNGVTHRLGFLYKNLRPEFEKTPRLIPMFKKAQRSAKVSFVLSVIGLAGVTSGLIISANAVDDQGYLINEHRYNNGVKLILGSAALAAINVPLQIKSRRQLDDAIWLRNRALLGQ